MPKVKAKVSFAGIITMVAGDIREITDDAILDDLKSAGYIEEITQTPKKKKGDEIESQ